MSASAEAAAIYLSERLRRLNNDVPGSREESIAERALNLCLFNRSTSSKDPQFLIHDCLRNAKSIHDASSKRGRRAMALYASQSYGRMEQEGDDGLVPIQSGFEDEVAARMSHLCEMAERLARHLGPTGGTFVQALMNGQSVQEAAKTAGISRALGYRWARHLEQALEPWREVAA